VIDNQIERDLITYFQEKIHQQKSITDIRNYMINNPIYDIVKNNTKLGKKKVNMILKRLRYRRHRTNMSIKHHTSCNYKQSSDDKYNFVKKLITAFIQNKTVIYIDDMSVTSRAIPEYLRIRSINDIMVNKKLRRLSRSIIAAVSPLQLPIFKIFKGSINSQSFGAFLLDLVQLLSFREIDLNVLYLLWIMHKSIVPNVLIV